MRRYASIANDQSSLDTLPHNAQPDYPSILASSLRRRDPKVWANLLDGYLPRELRLTNDELTSNGDDPQPIQHLPRLLLKARTAKPLKLDLLSYIGVYQGRWEAVIWLVKAMLKQSSNSTSALEWETAKIVCDMPWLTHSESLPELTAYPIWAEKSTKPSVSALTLDELTHARPSEQWRIPDYMKREGIGQIWQSIGCMILQAADRPEEDETFKLIMFNVHQILAHLHHIDALPETIYNYTPAEDPSVVRRPLTLYLLSSRIMAVLSDTVWKVRGKEIGPTESPTEANRTNNNYDLSLPNVQPKISKIGIEVWLDLVLWSCIEGGWISEGAWIVGEMMRRKGDQRWSAVNWHAIHKPSIESDAWSRVKSEIARSRMNQMGRGVSIAGRLGGPDMVQTVPRTVSSEAIVALIDGLVNTISRTTDSHGNSPTEIQQYLKACKNLLERQHFALDTNSWNAIVLRLIESGGFFLKAEPRFLEYIINLAPSYLKEPDSSKIDESPSSSAPGYVADQSTANLGLLHRTLRTFSEQGDVQGAFRIFRKLQALVDANRSRAIQVVALGLGDQDTAEANTDSTTGDLDATPGVHPEIPMGVLAAFLDLVTEAKLFDFGRWLLYSDEVDGPTVLPKMYSNKNLQPALLRYATAAADTNLLNKVTKSLKVPLPEDILRALMHCQIALGKWDAVGDLLTYFQEEKKMRWKAIDVMAVARAILRMEHNTKASPFNEAYSASSAHALLRSLLQGKYNNARDQSQLPDLSQIQLVNQLSCIFQTVPGSLSEVATAVHRPYGMSASCHISSRAFNILLEGVVDNHGSIAGRRLWDRWCRGIDPDAYQRLSEQSDGSEKVVNPNLHILRTIMRPITQARYSAGNSGSSNSKDASDSMEEHKQANQTSIPEGRGITENDSPANARDTTRLSLEDEDAILRWGVGMYRKFGLTNKEINLELPGAFSYREPDDDV